MEHHDQRHVEQLKLLTQTGPDTLMGKLLRQFWHPVATASKLTPGTARAIRILCEDLTLYRGESGTAYLIAGQCTETVADNAKPELVRIAGYSPLHEYSPA